MTNSKRYAVVGAAAVVAMSLVLAVGKTAGRGTANAMRGVGDGAASENSGAAKELLSARREIAELRRAMQRLEGRSVGVEQSLANLTASSTREADMTEPDREKEAAAVPEPLVGLAAHFRYADGYRAYVVNERRDPVWASEKETELQTFFKSEGFKGYSLTSLECKATICALELQNEDAPDPTTDPDSVRQYMGRDPFASQSFWAPIEHGLLVVLSRDGQELPNPASLEL